MPVLTEYFMQQVTLAVAATSRTYSTRHSVSLIFERPKLGNLEKRPNVQR